MKQHVTKYSLCLVIRPAVRKKRDTIFIHAGTDDLTKEAKTMKYVRSVAKNIEEMNGGSDTQLGISGIVNNINNNIYLMLKCILFNT